MNFKAFAAFLSKHHGLLGQLAASAQNAEY
jgi:hypothetical protein